MLHKSLKSVRSYLVAQDLFYFNALSLNDTGGSVIGGSVIVNDKLPCYILNRTCVVLNFYKLRP